MRCPHASQNSRHFDVTGIALAWRKSFPRPQAIEGLYHAMLACKLPGVTLLVDAPVIND
jgi:hypothetical protein